MSCDRVTLYCVNSAEKFIQGIRNNNVMTRGQDCQGGLYTEPQLRTMQEWWTASLGSGSPARFQPVQYKVTYHVPLNMEGTCMKETTWPMV